MNASFLIQFAAMLALCAVAGGCGGSDGDGTEPAPTEGASICFGVEELQVMGGKGLDAINEAEEGTAPPVSEPTLDQVVRGAFEPSLRNHLRELAASGGNTEAVVAAAEDALRQVGKNPQLLTDEASLERAFAEAQRLAEEGNYTSAECSAAAHARLDCGTTRRGSKRAFRSFIAILRSGDEARILSVLANRGNFEFIVVNHPNGDPILDVRHDRREAAAAVAERGGLPLRIRRFTNASKPRRNADFGFEAKWVGARRAIGKAALDCRAGAARALGVGLQRR